MKVVEIMSKKVLALVGSHVHPKVIDNLPDNYVLKSPHVMFIEYCLAYPSMSDYKKLGFVKGFGRLLNNQNIVEVLKATYSGLYNASAHAEWGADTNHNLNRLREILGPVFVRHQKKEPEPTRIRQRRSHKC